MVGTGSLLFKILFIARLKPGHITFTNLCIKTKLGSRSRSRSRLQKFPVMGPSGFGLTIFSFSSTVKHYRLSRN